MRYPVVLHTDDGIRFGLTVPAARPVARSHGLTCSGLLMQAAEKAMR